MPADNIVQQCLSGDGEARNSFVQRYAGIVWAAVNHVVTPAGPRDPAVDAADITQDVFLRLFRDDCRILRKYDPSRASLTTWLTVVSRNRALDAVRKKRHETVPFESSAHSPVIDDPSSDSPSMGIDIPADLLSARQALVLNMLFDREMSVPEVAKALDVSDQTVRSTKHKALVKLREHFRPGQAEGVESGGDVSLVGDV